MQGELLCYLILLSYLNFASKTYLVIKQFSRSEQSIFLRVQCEKEVQKRQGQSGGNIKEVNASVVHESGLPS